MTRYARSMEWLPRAQRATPNAAQTRSKAPSMGVLGAFPIFAERGHGPYLWDIDGNRYIDFNLGLAAVGLGYRHPAVDAAVIEQVSRGASFSLPTKLETEVAELLGEIIPCAESVRFVKSGSESTEAAMRIARVWTGRNNVLSIGYHGWHTVHDAAKETRPGVPVIAALLTRDVPWGDVAGLHDSWPEDVAAVLIEPALHRHPPEGYLEAVRKFCDDIGALLIFDEVVTGFRWHLGGAQAYYGVTPDLACFGKAMANGYPLSCVVGRRDIMDKGAPYISGTFGGEAVSLAAAKATIETYRTEPVIERIWRAGSRFIDGFNERANVLSGAHVLSMGGLPCKPRLVVGPARPTLGGWERPTEEQSRGISSLLLQECAARGVLLHPTSLNVSASHTDADIDTALAACSEALGVCLEAMSESERGYEKYLRGEVWRSSFERVSG